MSIDDDTARGPSRDGPDAAAPRGGVAEIFVAFLRLGCTAFGGPIAHLGYFRDEFVARRRWLDDAAFADLIALCQLLPGPASSQVGFAIGFRRGGLAGALAAWIAFTLPSAVLLLLAARASDTVDAAIGTALTQALALLAAAVVAHALWGMARTLTPDLRRAGIAVAAAVMLIVVPGVSGQILAILTGGLFGLLSRAGAGSPPPPTDRDAARLSRPTAASLLCVFVVLLLALPLAAGQGGAIALADAFYRAGALVFGGGHVVLPLLETGLVAPGWLDTREFLAGYGLAQAVPGPLFTVAGYYGALVAVGPGGVGGAAIALVAMFLPGMLVLLGTLPFAEALRRRPRTRSALAGVNAAVVGILAMALYDPVWISAVHGPLDAVLALAGALALILGRVPPLVLVAVAVAGGLSVGILGD